MASSALLRAARRPLSQMTIRQAASMSPRVVSDGKLLGFRQFSVFNEFSKNLKGEAKSNQEFQQSVKELNEKIGNVTEDLKVRTKKTTEKIYKTVDDVWTEAEATSKKVTANLKDKISAAKDEVSANVKGRLSAAKEEVKETFGLGNGESSGSSSTSRNVNDGNNASSAESSQSWGTHDSKESLGVAGAFFDKVKSTLSSAPKISQAFQSFESKISGIAKKGYDIVKEELSSSPSKRRKMQYASASPSSEARSTKTDIVILPTKQSRLGERWEAFKKKMQGHPIFKHVSGFSKPVVTKGQEIAEDMRERWETSDHPVVHKIQDLNETVFGETATALSFKEIRRRDPSFSLPDFVAEVQEMIRPVLTAYLKGDVETMNKYCSKEVIERCKAERTAYQTQGIFFDNKILHISEVDVRETKMMESTPIIIVAFQTQQIYCVRDREGLITAGGKDTIHTVYYAWAMQQLDAEELGEGAYYPVWRLREMQQLGIQALI